MFAFTTQRRITAGSQPYPRFSGRDTATRINRRKWLKTQRVEKISLDPRHGMGVHVDRGQSYKQSGHQNIVVTRKSLRTKVRPHKESGHSGTSESRASRTH
jgi:hypothetical protein